MAFIYDGKAKFALLYHLTLEFWANFQDGCREELSSEHASSFTDLIDSFMTQKSFFCHKKILKEILCLITWRYSFNIFLYVSSTCFHNALNFTYHFWFVFFHKFQCEKYRIMVSSWLCLILFREMQGKSLGQNTQFLIMSAKIFGPSLTYIGDSAFRFCFKANWQLETAINS